MGHVPTKSDGHAKRRALRIPLDYVRTRDPITRWKWLLSGLALVMLAAFWSWRVSGDPQGLVVFSPGPLTAAHRSWDAQCSVCHTDLVPLRSDSWDILHTGLSASDSAVSPQMANDQKCQVCHRVAIHHANQMAQEIPACAGCHVDHRGAEVLLGKVADQRCVDCHAEIGRHGGAEHSKFVPPIADVRSFLPLPGSMPTPAPAASGIPPRGNIDTSPRDTQHPEFRSLAEDPGNIKFNHALHLLPGIPAFDPKSEGKALMTLATLPPEYRAQYRGADQSPEADRDQEFVVQLTCNSCHEYDSPSAKGILPSTTKGTDTATLAGNPLPINYERHCRACHPLRFSPASDEFLPHGLQPARIREYLFGHYARPTAPRTLPDTVIPPRPIPGRGAEDLERNVRAMVAEQVQASERFLADSKTCCKCHIAEPHASGADATLLPTLRPAAIPTTWFRHAHFDHGAHQQSKCVECHLVPEQSPSSRPAGLESSCAADAIEGPQDQRRVMILGREKCLECHAPRREENGKGGARWDCAECHRYHGGAPPTREGL